MEIEVAYAEYDSVSPRGHIEIAISDMILHIGFIVVNKPQEHESRRRANQTEVYRSEFQTIDPFFLHSFPLLLFYLHVASNLHYRPPLPRGGLRKQR